MAGGEEGATLEFTPTWIVAVVCTVIVAISLAMERLLHVAGVVLKKKHQKPLYEALSKVKEELMLMGFISLLLTVFQGAIAKICVSKDTLTHMLPCKLEENKATGKGSNSETTSHFQTYFASTLAGSTRHLLAEESASSHLGYCAKKGKAPLLTVEALHHLHIFIFVLAIVHVVFCVLTVSIGGLKVSSLIWFFCLFSNLFSGCSLFLCLFSASHKKIKIFFVFLQHSFFKQFSASVTKSDYVTLRLGFIMMHCRGNPKFNFHKYMIRALEDDFKHVVGIRQVYWYLWVFVVIFLLLNVNGWHAYFWLAFIPVILLLAVGTKLEHVITQLAQEVAERHVAIEGELVVQPSDDHFWFNRPRIVLFLIHFTLFQNAFEIAFFFWIWVQYGFDSCVMGQVRYIVPRLVIGVFVQALCSFSTLPLYAIVTQMGSSFKKAIFDEHVQIGLVGWAQKAKKRKGLKATSQAAAEVNPEESPSVSIQMGSVLGNASDPEEIHPLHGSN
ncbi:MLO-like protein 15 [Hibiscus syriacus]|uniref:MLO-like protein n=1 Tax=Hibiscus syriacus TaxID=106335 RepID=A0A6A3C171_HIBSY|nr:MLO-like protein 15 [Hibiscus syriacus]